MKRRKFSTTFPCSFTPNNEPVKDTCPSILDSPQVTILYLNVCGLTDVKLSSICFSLHKDTLFFIAETWYINHQARLSNHLVVASTLPSPSKHTGRRRDHGMILLCPVTFAPYIKIITTTEFSIMVRLKDTNTTIAAVYLPPSLPPSAVETELKALGTVSVLLGDLNVRLGASVGDTVSGPPERLASLCTYLDRANLVYIRPSTTTSGLVSRVDHLFTSPTISEQCKLLLEQPIVKTDHPMLKMVLKDPFHSSPSIDPIDSYSDEIQRPCISLLSNPVMAHLFRQAVHSLCSSLETHLDDPIHTKSESTEFVIDTLDGILLDIIQVALEETVGTYSPSKLHPNPNSNSNQRQMPIYTLDYGETVRLFKKTQRMALKNLRLESSAESCLSLIEEAFQYYRQLFSAPPNLSSSTVFYNLFPFSPPSNPFIGTNTLAWAIRQYPSGRSPGIDGIDNRVMKCLLDSPSFLACLSRLFSLCYESEYTPRRWNESIIHPIQKNPSLPHIIANCRPISLTAIFRRLFEKILLTDLIPTVSLNCGQAGFRSGFSCVTQALVADEALHHGSHINVFIDLKAAYDRVSISRLLNKLYTKNVHPKLVNILSSLFSQCSSKVAVNGALSPSFPRERGLFQGSLLAPWLFNVYIDDLAAELNNSNNFSSSPFPPCLLFADDILLQTCELDPMLKMLNTVERWCDENDMMINTSKCAILAPPQHCRSPVLLGGLPIPSPSRYLYLGIPFDRKHGLDISAHVKRRCIQADRLLSTLSSNLATASWPEIAKLAIYKAFIRPIIEYAAPLIPAMHAIATQSRPRKKKKPPDPIASMNEIQAKALSWIFGRRSPAPALLSLSGLAPMTLRLEELSARFLLHLIKMCDSNPLKRIVTDPALQSPRLKKILKQIPDLPSPLGFISIKYHFYEKRLSFFSSMPSILARYILPCSRMNSGMDFCMSIPSSPLRRSIIRWRCNATRLRSQCSNCGSTFLRAHLAKCPDVLETCATTFNLSLTALLTNAAATIQGVHHYTLLDHLLNLRQYSLFEKILALLSKS